MKADDDNGESSSPRATRPSSWTWRARPFRQGNVVFVFDSVSDLLLHVGLEKTSKFLRQLLEIMREQWVTAFFILVGAPTNRRTPAS